MRNSAIKTKLRRGDPTPVIVQIESPRALDEMEAIAKAPGVDVLMLGPGDPSVLSGVPFEFEHLIVLQARARIAAAAKAAGIHWGTTSPTPEHSRALLADGARFICHGADILFIKRAFDQMQQQYSAQGFTFDNRLGALATELQNYL